MKLLLHLIKFNFIFNKIRLAFLSIVSLGLLGLGSYFHTETVEFGEFLIQYSLYFFFMIMTGKMSAKNNLMFDIKHMLAMPMTKKDIVFTKSIADVVHFLPIALVFLIGVAKAKPEFHIALVTPIFFSLLVIANMITLNKRVDFSRMQHARASFKNSFLFLHKYFEMGLVLLFTSITAGLLFSLMGKNVLLLEYVLFLVVCIAGFLSFNQTLKMLKDETRSYFVVKRDTFRIAWKGAIIIIPSFFFHQVYQNDNYFQNMRSEKVVKAFQKEIQKIKNKKDSRFLASIYENKEVDFQKYLKENAELPWNQKLKGLGLTHIAAWKNPSMLIELVQRDVKSIHFESEKLKRTPLYFAIHSCKASSIEYLLKNNASVNHQDIDGVTPLMFALKKNCETGVILLRDRSDHFVVDNKNRGLSHYIGDNRSMSYLIGGEARLKNLKRELASKKVVGPK